MLTPDPLLTGDPYRRVTFRGRPLDAATAAALLVAEDRLGYQLTIVQGIGGAAASAGTHTEGRAVDLVDWDTPRKVRVLRDVGFAVWYRADLPGVWSSHIHAVLVLNARDNSRGIAAAALRQIGSYDRGRDGLAGDGVDPNPYRPNPAVTFRHPVNVEVPPVKRTKVQEARDKLVEALHALGDANAHLRDAEGRPVAGAQVDDVVKVRRDIRALLEKLPAK